MVKNPIIPQHPVYLHGGNASFTAPHGSELDLKSIAIWGALGFFLGDTTFYTDVKVLPPSCSYEDGRVSAPDWNWHYSPRDIALHEAVNEFQELFEGLVSSGVKEKQVILPLSGGLDSRSLAAACRGLPSRVNAYSYEFANGINEVDYGRKIATACGFPFEAYSIDRGYLWEVLEELASLNNCYTEFTHSRQIAVVDRVAATGDVFLLGHWGDVLFESMAQSEKLDFDLQVQLLIKKFMKKGGLEFGKKLWNAWGLGGVFEDVLRERISKILGEIKIDHASARLRAFKSMTWAGRWANSNMATFSSRKPVLEPYETDEMCQFICTLPEELLSGRQIQIEYIKRVHPGLARISWQAQRPYNLFTYKRNRRPWNLGYRVAEKVGNKLRGTPRVVQNWQLQLLGEDNLERVRHYLNESRLDELIPSSIVEDTLNSFVATPQEFNHPVSMLLALAMFNRRRFEERN